MPELLFPWKPSPTNLRKEEMGSPPRRPCSSLQGGPKLKITPLPQIFPAGLFLLAEGKAAGFVSGLRLRWGLGAGRPRQERNGATVLEGCMVSRESSIWGHDPPPKPTHKHTEHLSFPGDPKISHFSLVLYICGSCPPRPQSPREFFRDHTVNCNKNALAQVRRGFIGKTHHSSLH